jgi:monoamine oxidase
MSLSFFRRLRACVEPEVVSRREVLRATGAAVGGLFVHERLAVAAAGPRGPNQTKRVLVIGAGFAGLACADELAAAGYLVTVVEARGRVGGRVETRHDVVERQTVEAGGELVGENQPTWVAYQQRFQLEFIPMEEKAVDVIGLDGKLLGKEAAVRLYHETDLALRELNRLARPIPAYTPWKYDQAFDLDQQSLRDWIDRQDVSDECKVCMAVQFTAINGIVPAWQSLLGVLAIVSGGGLDQFWDETDTKHVLGGCQQLATKLRESLQERGGEVRLNCPVRSVRVLKNRVEVVCHDGKKEEWDDVVLTAPPSVWNKIDFAPALPPGLTTPLADNVKYLAVTRGQPWKHVGRNVNALSNGPIQLTWETTDSRVAGGEHAVVAITGGPDADVCRSWAKSGELHSKYNAELERFWPGFAKASVEGKGMLSDWSSDPYSRGSYSFPAPGQVTLAGPLLAEGIGGRLHFAGEHCCYAFTGWMEGALSSGVRLAHTLCERDGVEKKVSGLFSREQIAFR